MPIKRFSNTEYHRAFNQNTHFIQKYTQSNSDGDNDSDGYEQNYEQETEFTDANMFLFSLVPWRLIFVMTDSTNDKLLKNLSQSSTRYC
jgi:hypothetical protein